MNDTIVFLVSVRFGGEECSILPGKIKRSPSFIQKVYYNLVPFSKRYGKVFNETYDVDATTDAYNNTILMPKKGSTFPTLLFDGAAGSAVAGGSGVDTLTFIKFN